MKLNKLTVIGMFALGFVVGARADDIKINVPSSGSTATAAAPAAAPAATATIYSEAQILETIGWMAGKNTQLDLFKLTPTQLESVMKGLSASLSGKDVPFDPEKIGPQLQAFVERKQSEFLNAVKVESAKESAAYFAKLKDNKAVVESASGLRYEVLVPGTGANPKPSDTVKVHYTGKLLDGTVFDSSIQRGEPAEFPLDGVIPGWTEGIQKIAKGGKIRLHVPASLAYGDTGRGNIPPGAALIFEVELLDFKATPPAAAPAAAPAAGK
jgi:FKBP-type peptidyl-prolyl cis-trans isomerase